VALLFCVAIAATTAVVVAPTASTALATTSATCTSGTTTFSATLSLPPAQSFTPILVSYADSGASAGVLVPQTIVLNGETIVSAIPGLDVSALSGQKTTCTFHAPRGTFDVTGILAPVSP
jgi:hypothetical protein